MFQGERGCLVLIHGFNCAPRVQDVVAYTTVINEARNNKHEKRVYCKVIDINRLYIMHLSELVLLPDLIGYIQ